MQNDSFKMRPHYAPYNRSEESHRRTDGYMYFSLWSWDISLSLNMTWDPLSARCATSPEGESEISFTVFASGAKQSPGRVEVYEVYVAYFFIGIAAPAARNDVPFLRVILNDSEESHRRTDGAYTPHFGCGIFRVRSIWRYAFLYSNWLRFVIIYCCKTFCKIIY